MRNKSHDGALYLRTSTVSIVGQGQPISVVNCSRVAGDEPAHLSPQTGISREKPDQSALSAVTTLGAAPRLHSSAGAHDRSEVLAAALMHGLGLALFRLRTRVQRVGRCSKRERLNDRLQTQAILGPVRPTVMRRAMAALDDSQSVNPMRAAANCDHDGTTPAHPPLPPPWPRRACRHSPRAGSGTTTTTRQSTLGTSEHDTRHAQPHARTCNCHGCQRWAGRHGATERLQPHVGHSGEVYDKQQPR